MSIPQVYLFEFDDGEKIASENMVVFSSRTKAVSFCNRGFDLPDFKRDSDVTTVSVDGSTVGWITKKIVQ